MKELKAKIKDLEGQQIGSLPPYVLKAALKAAKDLEESDTEEELVRRVAGWIKIGLTDTDKARRQLIGQLGSFILSADVGDRKLEPGQHDWKPVPNNKLNFTCGNCGIVGYKAFWDAEKRIRAPYDCSQFTKLTTDRT
jgi:hypothetical protein